MKNQVPAKRIDIVSIHMVKESSFLYQSRYIQSPSDVVNMMNQEFKLDKLDRESFIIIALDAKCRPTHINTVSTGSLTASIVHPREVFKVAILANAHSIIAVHNHPSGNPTPSNEDRQITKRLKEASAILGINFLEHIIIGENGNYTSMKEEGEL